MLLLKKKLIMANETLNHIMTLRAINKALVDALEAAVYYLDNVDQISQEQRKSMVKSLNALISQCGAVYDEAPRRR